jgi:hypothetical protein
MMIIGLTLVGWALVAGAADDPSADQGKDPIFVQWLKVNDPVDETIREYWERAKADELSPEGLVDLGTMLYHRGWPNDAVKMYKKALDQNKKLYEAWYRIGVVKHRDREFEDARYAYKKCLKQMVGHGWCNFYLGLLEEQTGHPSKALEYYTRAYKSTPELADPKVNPDVMYSKLQLGAALYHQDRERFTETVPMPYLDPAEVRKVKAQYLPTPTPTPVPTPTPKVHRATTRQMPEATTTGGTSPQRGTTGAATGGAATGGAVTGGSRVRTRPTAPDPDRETPYGVRRPTESGGTTAAGAPRSVSPEASLAPLWNRFPEWILAFV